jgi:hypothetical protein
VAKQAVIKIEALGPFDPSVSDQRRAIRFELLRLVDTIGAVMGSGWFRITITPFNGDQRHRRQIE